MFRKCREMSRNVPLTPDLRKRTHGYTPSGHGVSVKRQISSKAREQLFRARGLSTPSSNGASNGDIKTAKPRAKSYLREYARWLKPYRREVAKLMVIATICAALDKVWPLAIKAAIDLLVPGQAERNLLHFDHLCVLMVVVVLIKQVLDSYRSYQTDVLNAQVTFRLRKRLFHRLIGLSLGELSAMKAGGITSRLSGDVDSASGLIQMALISPGVAGISVFFTLIILTWMNWRLAVVALVAIPPLALSSYFWTRKVRPIYRSIREDRSEIDGRVNETFGGIRVVRSFRRESREERTYAVGHHATIRKGLYAERLQLVLTTIWGILIPGVVVLIVAYGGHLVARDKATVGQIVAFQIYMMMLLQPIWQIVSSISQTQRALAAMERVFDVLNTPLDKPDVPDAARSARPPCRKSASTKFSSNTAITRPFCTISHLKSRGARPSHWLDPAARERRRSRTWLRVSTIQREARSISITSISVACVFANTEGY